MNTVTLSDIMTLDSQMSNKQEHFLLGTIRSSRSKVFCKQGDLKKISKFTGKHQCWSLFLNKVAVLEKHNWITHWITSVMKELKLK